MPFAQRDEMKQVVGLFANAQPGFAEEWLNDDDPEAIAFLDRATLPEQNWGMFRMGMISDASYVQYAMAAIAATPVFFQQLQIAIAMAEPYLPAIMQLWAIVLNSVPLEQRPALEASDRWNQLAAAAHLPFRFDSQGAMLTSDKL